MDRTTAHPMMPGNVMPGDVMPRDDAMTGTVSPESCHPQDGAAAAERTRRGTARMFESDFIERFSRVHPLMPAALYLPVVGASIYAAIALHAVPLPRLGLQLFVGYLLWTLCEYWLHR